MWGNGQPSERAHDIRVPPEGVYFKEVGFLFPQDIILAYPRKMEFYSPAGCRFGMYVTKPTERLPVFQLDKPRLLMLLAERAERAGVEIRYGTRVTDILQEHGCVCGVAVDSQELRSKIVICAEGLSRKLANRAGLYATRPVGYIYLIAEYRSGYDFADSELGQKSIFGQALKSLRATTGAFHTLGRDRAMFMLGVFSSEQRWGKDKSAAEYLEELVTTVPWMSQLWRGSTPVGKKGCWIVLERPASLVTKGLIGTGDCVAPLGHSANAIAMLMGMDAGLAAARAVQENNPGSKALDEYNQKWIKNPLFKGVEFEANLILKMLEFTDDEVERICTSLAGFNLEPFFLGSRWQMLGASLRMLFKKEVIRNWKLVRQLF